MNDKKFLCGICCKPTDNEETSYGLVLHTCDECKARIHKEVHWESIGETWREDTVVCPFCGYRYAFEDCYEIEEGEDEYECASCGRKIVVEKETVFRYTTKRSSSEMPDDFDPDNMEEYEEW